MQFDDLPLAPEEPFHVTIVGQDYKRHACIAHLIGYRRGQALMAYIPHKPPQVMLRNGLKVEARLATATGMARFNSRIEELHKTPCDYLRLAWPEELVFEPLRREPRFRYQRAAELVAHTGIGVSAGRIGGKLLDVSEHGARLLSDKELTDIVRKITLTVSFVFAGFEQQLSLDAVLRSRHTAGAHAGSQFDYGLEFVDLKSEPRLWLYALCRHLEAQGAALDCPLPR